ncbi:MAG: hypothetical protein KAQ79_09950 [Cyclobacteriaceae bacterium]|nr:hypothetical protein [Cyclobacteriaceae bacterium]
MKLIEVKDKQSEKDFLMFPVQLYKNEKHWIRPLDKDINNVFDKDKNKYYRKGELIRWILKDDSGKIIGRVAAFINKKTVNKDNDQPTGGMGFFECINDKRAAFILFDACRDWLKDNGTEAMDGPINFGENDNFWGLLVEGFTHPSYGMNYNFPYYEELFVAYGFSQYFEQISNHLDLRKPFPERFWKIAEWVMRKPGYSFKHFKKNEVDKFAADIVEIHNAAWVFHEHYSPLDIDKIKKGFKEAKDIIIEDFIWFAYHENQPIGFLVMLPDMNKIFSLFKGRLNLWNKIRFLFLKHTKIVNRSRITIMGVIPKFQGIGIESAIFWHLQDPLLKKRPHYKEIEISWVGDFNPKMKATLNAMGANPGKTHITYRKLIAKNAKFKTATAVTDIKENIIKNE